MGAWQPKLQHWAGLNFPAYNGGLFAADPALDALHVPDEVCAPFKDLGDYDYPPSGGATWSSALVGGLLLGTGLFVPSPLQNRATARALPGRSAAAARLRSWRWGKTARKPAKLAC